MTVFSDKMRFHGKFSLIQRPTLWGKSDSHHFDHYVFSSCHEFSVSNVDIKYNYLKYSSKPPPVSEVPSNVTYVAGKHADEFLYGPASSLKSRTIIYTCERYRCRLGCPCQLCRVKHPHCNRATTNETCGDCSKCRQDYDDHLLHHRVHHYLCKFCINVQKSFPQFAFTVLITRGDWLEQYQVTAKSYIVKHVYNDSYQNHNKSTDFKCDNCDAS